MANIVELQAFDQKRAKRRDTNGNAEIVIFPGVRIDRKSFSLADRLAPAERSAARSRAGTSPGKSED